MRGEATPAAVDTSKCDVYKTDAAKKYCGEQAVSTAKKSKAAAAAEDASPLSMNNGIFGDSGVTYSKGVEELCAALSKQQARCCHASSDTAQAAEAGRGGPRRAEAGRTLVPSRASSGAGEACRAPFWLNLGGRCCSGQLRRACSRAGLPPPMPARRAGSGSFLAPTVRTRTSPRPTWASSEATSPKPPRRPWRANPRESEHSCHHTPRLRSAGAGARATGTGQRALSTSACVLFVA